MPYLIVGTGNDLKSGNDFIGVLGNFNWAFLRWAATF